MENKMRAKEKKKKKKKKKKTEQNRTEQNRTEQNRTEQNRTEQNRTEQNRTEQKEKYEWNDRFLKKDFVVFSPSHAFHIYTIKKYIFFVKPY